MGLLLSLLSFFLNNVLLVFVAASSSDSKVAVLLYSQKVATIALKTVLHFNKHLDNTWRIQIFYDSRKIPLNYWHSKLKNHFSKFKDRFLFADFGNVVHDRDSLNRFMILNTTFWRSVAGNVILIVQPDASICNGTSYKIDRFLSYDFIGAPFLYNWISEKSSVPLNEFIPVPNDEFFGCNGGFSLRSRKAMIDCSLYALANPSTVATIPPEDVYFSKCLKHYLNRTVSLPSKQVSGSFSAEGVLLDPRPFGQHKAFTYMKERQDDLTKLIANCPDIPEANSRHNAMGGERRQLFKFLPFEK